MSGDPSGFAAALIARADAARDARNWAAAAVLYGEALRIRPDDAGIQVQCGHMLKEAGNLAAAGERYAAAALLTPDDADLALQTGHYHKVAGHIREAVASYRRAGALQPGWAEPARELATLLRGGWRDAAPHGAPAARDHAATGPAHGDVDDGTVADGTADFSREAEALRLAGSGRLVPEIVPRLRHEMFHPHGEGIQVRRLGKRERSRWGMIPTLRGVEAVRGFAITASPVVEVQLLLNGLLLHRGPPRGGYRLLYERERPLLKYVFNIWLDLSGFEHVRCEAEVRCVQADGQIRSHRENVAVAAPWPEAEHPHSDGIITLPPDDARPVVEQVNSRASVVRPAGRALLPAVIGNVLVVRPDQLGDMVTSIPAMRRLRELLPGSHLVGLLTAGNAEFAGTLGLFDEIIVVDYPDDLLDRRRTMPLDKQEALRARLAPYAFELAVDLSESNMSRPLTLLSGAKFTYGFNDVDFPWLDAGFTGNTHDIHNGRETAPHSTRVLAFVERLGPLLRSGAEVLRRPEVTRERLAAYGIGPGERFAVLHTGARIVFSRWAHYPALAARLLRDTELKVVLMTDEPAVRGALPAGVLGSDRFLLLDGRLPFDDFDAFLSFCAVLVGNDSGPKHLAALRGSPVVSVHSARVNWSEWGQELSGCIVSRKVPCAGCQLYHDDDECGQDFVCVTRISVDEVFEAAMRLVPAGAPAPAA